MAPLTCTRVLVLLGVLLGQLGGVGARRLPHAIKVVQPGSAPLMALRGGADASGDITIRIRTKDGMKRATIAPEATLHDLQRLLLRDFKYPVERQRIARSPGGASALDAAADAGTSLSALGIKHGSMLHLELAPQAGSSSSTAPPAAPATAPSPPAAPRGRRRRGTTMADFEDERKAFEVVLETPGAATCQFVAVEPGAGTAFADFVLDNEFEECRVALLFGRFVEPPVGGGKRGVYVDVVYEPPQECSAEAIVLDESDDAAAEVSRAHALAASLGMRLVGIAYAHPPRHHTLEASEVALIVAQRAVALEADAAAKGLFVGMRFRPVYEGEPIDGDVTAEAYQPTEQAAELASKGVLVGCDPAGEHAGHASLAPSSGLSFKLGPKTEDVADLSYFVARVHDLSQPYVAPACGALRRAFPVANRGGAPLRKFHLRGFLDKQREAGLPFATSALDFQLLLHVSSLLPPDVFRALCEALPVVSGSSSKKARDAAANAIAEAEAWLVKYAGSAAPPKGAAGARK